jgi:hypothetical protein
MGDDLEKQIEVKVKVKVKVAMKSIYHKGHKGYFLEFLFASLRETRLNLCVFVSWRQKNVYFDKY